VSGKRRAVRAGALVVGASTVALLASGCTANEAFFFDLPTPATEEAPIIQNLWQGSWIAAWAVGAVTLILILWAIFAYRRRKNSDVPEQTKYNMPIEVLYTIVPLVMILGLFWFTAKDQSEILTIENDQKQTVNVVGWKWSWGFNYIDEDVFESGTPDYIPTLVLPVNEKVRFELTSPDVIHSFWVPSFLFKMDVIPGKTNVFELTPNKLGTFAGKCTELCGTYHSGMLFNVKVVERPEFEAYIEALKARGNTGLLDTGRTNNDGAIPGERTL
jgi:cytochrome c oxidase subunit 2